MSRTHRDISTLKSMLSYKRPDGSLSEQSFIDRFIRPLGVEEDGYGNSYKRIPFPDGAPIDVLWSSHTDTVHRLPGRQKVVYDRRTDTLKLADPKASNCLGADCGAGVFIMTEMIKAGVPGLYVFHRGEECGANGAHFIRKQKTLLEGIQMAIAFDRMAHTSVITYQCGSRTASNAFAESLIAQLPGYKIDDGGIFTDTKVYEDVVPECTNLSVGYQRQHSCDEVQSVDTLLTLRDAMVRIDTRKLVVARDPKVKDTKGWGTYTRDSYGLGTAGTMSSLCYHYSYEVSQILRRIGITFDGLAPYVKEQLRINRAQWDADDAVLFQGATDLDDDGDDDLQAHLDEVFGAEIAPPQQSVVALPSRAPVNDKGPMAVQDVTLMGEYEG